jgi:hypothetical protein
MAEHTPGPWMIDDLADGKHMADQVENNRDWLAVEVADDDIGGHVAYCHYRNAPLIAAAPEMLAALKKCKQALKNYIDSGYDEDEDQEAYTAAMAALRKAEGRGE